MHNESELPDAGHDAVGHPPAVLVKGGAAVLGGHLLEHAEPAVGRRVHRLPQRVGLLDRLDGARALRTGHHRPQLEEPDMQPVHGWHLPRCERQDGV